MKNEEDIVEHALNWGVKSAGKRFHVSDSIVRSSVIEFVKDCSVCQCIQNDDIMRPIRFICSRSLSERVRKIGISNFI